jgi:hypothetical protein
MTLSFSISATSHYDRLAQRLLRQHAEFDTVEDRARAILRADPYNHTRRHAIRTLEGVPQGEGQYRRLTLGWWRFRYDIDGREVWLFY